MKLSISTVMSVFLFTTITFAAPASANSEKSRQIKQAVDAFAPIMQSGVDTYMTTPNLSTHDALLEIFVNDGEEVSDFSWVAGSGEAWDIDSSNWGQTDMKAARAYIVSEDREYIDSLQEEGNEGAIRVYRAQLKRAAEEFSLLVGTGVKFGIAPRGAVQCGVRFPALAIIDPHSGTVYMLAKEPSGC